jgi:hypothetical protein
MNRIIIALCLLCFLAPYAFGDIIIFKDNTQLNARVREIVNGQVGVQTETETYYIPMYKIKDIIYIKPVKEDVTMKWVITGSAILMCLLGFVLAMWGRGL